MLRPSNEQPDGGATVANDLTWEEATISVLRDAEGALHYSDIAERILASGLRSPVPNPANVVASRITTSIGRGDSPFVKVARGEYILRDRLADDAPAATPTAEPTEPDSDAGAIQAFGMFWRRDIVQWERSKPTLLGRQGAGAEAVDFAEQVGVYLLHDRDRVIYAGRAAEALHTRLRAHTWDRLAGRWDRFSWFGLRRVEDDGSLSNPAVAWTHNVVIETLEAVLIESLEPPLNRKRGDNFTGVEYLQAEDPKVELARKREVVAELTRAAGLT